MKFFCGKISYAIDKANEDWDNVYKLTVQIRTVIIFEAIVKFLIKSNTFKLHITTVMNGINL